MRLGSPNRLLWTVLGNAEGFKWYFVLETNVFKCFQVFGSKGDFITSPELTQLFGEMIGVWYAAGSIADIFNLINLGSTMSWRILDTKDHGILLNWDQGAGNLCKMY